jgi:hypothetical protein
MKKSVLEEELEGYKFALSYIENNKKNKPRFICVGLIKYCIKKTVSYDSFPEFIKYRPAMIPFGQPWWPPEDKQSREEFLKKLIKDIEIKIHKNLNNN